MLFWLSKTKRLEIYFSMLYLQNLLNVTQFILIMTEHKNDHVIINFTMIMSHFITL